MRYFIKPWGDGWEMQCTNIETDIFSGKLSLARKEMKWWQLQNLRSSLWIFTCQRQTMSSERQSLRRLHHLKYTVFLYPSYWRLQLRAVWGEYINNMKIIKLCGRKCVLVKMCPPMFPELFREIWASVRDKEVFIKSKISQNRQGHIKNSTQREQRWGKTVTER